MQKIIQILIEVLLFFVNFFRLLKRSLFWFFKRIIKKPFFLIFRFIYHLFVLPLYRFYLFTFKKNIFKRNEEGGAVSILIKKKFVYILIIIITFSVIYSNLTTPHDAIASEEVVGKTILGQLVLDELTNKDKIIEEYQDETILQHTQHKYVNQYTYLEPSKNIATKEKIKIEEFNPGKIASTDLENKLSLTTTKSVEARDKIIDYTVQSGDTVSTIAQKFAISVNTILWANDLTAYSYIRPGQKLKILPMSGVMHKVQRGENLIILASKYDVGQEKIMQANNLSNPNQLRIGQDLMIPGGSKIKTIARRKTTTRKIYPKQIAIFKKGKDSQKPVYNNKMHWPTEGHRITQYFSWRHNAIDIANKIGTPIYAADAGTVEIAGWNRYGYGNQILLNHGGGKKTRYAHLSSFGVKVGDVVKKGQYIGAMGSTGHSTGPHVHFEVIINGKHYNPLNYVEY